jgi:hypothetical protein
MSASAARLFQAQEELRAKIALATPALVEQTRFSAVPVQT